MQVAQAGVTSVAAQTMLARVPFRAGDVFSDWSPRPSSNLRTHEGRCPSYLLASGAMPEVRLTHYAASMRL